MYTEQVCWERLCFTAAKKRGTFSGSRDSLLSKGEAGGRAATRQGERQGQTHAHHALPSNAARVRLQRRTLCPRRLSEACPEAPANGKGNPQLSSCWLGTTILPGSSWAADHRMSPKRAVDGWVRHIFFPSVTAPGVDHASATSQTQRQWPGSTGPSLSPLLPLSRLRAEATQAPELHPSAS